MSSTSFPASADLALALNEPECEPSPSARSSRSSGQSSASIGLTWPVTMISEPSPPNVSGQTGFPWMRSVEDSPAKTSRKPGNLAVSKPNAADFGLNTLGSFANYDPKSSSWRTSQICLSGELAEFSETWPRSGTMLGGVVSGLAISEPPTSEIGFGLLPTPRAAKRGARNPRTAIASLHRRGRTKAHKLEDALAILEGRTGVPNPEYVEWMMGLKPTWTELEPAATPSSRKSPKSSGARS